MTGAEPAAPVGPAAAGPRVVAHRGAPRIARENTVPALLAAVGQGADAIEVDVRTTSDGVSVVLHDATTTRLWGGDHVVAETTWEELSRLGSAAGEGGRGSSSERIPRLVDVLDALDALDAADGTSPVLLVDSVDARDARAAAEAVASWHAQDGGTRLTTAWCGHPDAVAAVLEVLPGAETWLAWPSLTEPTEADLERLRPSTLNLDVAFLTPGTVRAAHALGLAVSCWTVDSPVAAAWAAATGADSITTNDVPLVRAALAGDEVVGASSSATELARTEGDDDDVSAAALRLAREAAEHAIAFVRRHPVTRITTKAHPADLVTDVDRELEQHVRGLVRASFPSHAFSGEEFGFAAGSGGAAGLTWHLDPVDGTTNLAAGIPWTSTSLCLTRGAPGEGDGDEPLVGVVADPWRGEVLAARRGHGASRARSIVDEDGMPRAEAPRPGEPLALTGDASLAGGVVGTELDGHRPWPGMAAFLDVLAERSCTLRVMGSGTLTLAQVAAGRGVGGCVGAFHAIDHGAAVLLVLEAGGVVATPAGPVAGLPPHGAPVLVAHPAVADELLAIWRAARRSAGSG